MSRWIDADALKANINTAFWSEIEKIIDSAPSLDLVRCAECKHKEVCFSEVAMTNKHQTSTIYERIDFCSYGCRKESE